MNLQTQTTTQAQKTKRLAHKKPALKVITKASRPIKPLSLEQELFCQLYVNNDSTFANATACYANAYGYDLKNADRTPQTDEQGRTIKFSSDYDRMENTCSGGGSRLLANMKINDRVNELFLLSMNDNVVDQELMKVVKQNYKLDAKVSAVKEYNKLKQRIVDRLDHTSDGKPIQIQISEAVARKNGL